MKNSSSTSPELKIHGVLLSKNSISPVILEAKNSLDTIYKVSSRLNRSFLGEGSFLSSIYIVPLILLVGLVFASIWLFCACVYYNMKGKKFKLPCQGRKKNKQEEDPPKTVLTPAMLQVRRQERLSELQAECSCLEQQLTEYYLTAKGDNNIFSEEKGTRLTSRASDSDLEYLNSDSPPLKRNSISLQDLPQSVLRLRREKELRTLKTEIEYLKKVSEISARRSQSTESVSKNIQPLAITLISPREPDIKFLDKKGISSSVEHNGRLEPEVLPLSQHIDQLKTQRRLNQIRTELEDLAIKFISKSEQEAKCSSLQDLPRTALNVSRERQLLTITNEIEKMKKYSMGQGSIVNTVLQGKKRLSQKSLISLKEESPSFKEGEEEKDAGKETKDNSGPAYGGHNSSLKRQREQELYRVRTELKNLADKLNYTIEDRSKFVSTNNSLRSSMKKPAEMNGDDDRIKIAANNSVRTSVKKQAEIIAEDVETAQHV